MLLSPGDYAFGGPFAAVNVASALAFVDSASLVSGFGIGAGADEKVAGRKFVVTCAVRGFVEAGAGNGSETTLLIVSPIFWPWTAALLMYIIFVT